MRVKRLYLFSPMQPLFTRGYLYSGIRGSSLRSLAHDLGRPGGSVYVAIILPFWEVSTLEMTELSPLLFHTNNLRSQLG